MGRSSKRAKQSSSQPKPAPNAARHGTNVHQLPTEVVQVRSAASEPQGGALMQNSRSCHQQAQRPSLPSGRPSTPQLIGSKLLVDDLMAARRVCKLWAANITEGLCCIQRGRTC